MPRIMAASSGDRVRAARIRRGLTQGELARRCAISRQALGAIESNTYQPGVGVALNLARELDASVESLFADFEPERVAAAVPGARAGGASAGSRVALARVGGRLIAVPRSAAGLGLAPAAGMIRRAPASGGRAEVESFRSREEIEATLLVAGCDPTAPLLADWLRRRRAAVEMVALPGSSRGALAALLDGCVHVAGVHLRDPQSGEYNLKPVREALGRRPAVLVNFARWELGLVTAAQNPLGIRGFADLARPGLRIVNREAGSGARNALEEAVAELGLDRARIAGYGVELPGHLDVAAAVAGGRADLAVTLRVAADAYGLGFVPVREERYDLVILSRELEGAPVRTLLEALDARRFGVELARLCAYDTSQMGRVMARFNC